MAVQLLSAHGAICTALALREPLVPFAAPRGPRRSPQQQLWPRTCAELALAPFHLSGSNGIDKSALTGRVKLGTNLQIKIYIYF